MKPKIKFSHRYYKLQGIENGDIVSLLGVFPFDLEKDLNNVLHEYDTLYHEKGESKYYPLPQKGKYLLLVFVKSGMIPSVFTTIRRWTPRKESYYRMNRGLEFEVIKPSYTEA